MMQVLDDLAHVRRENRAVVTIGTFDGIHRGHQAVIAYLLERARQKDGTSTVVSFHPHPREVVRGDIVPLLTTIDERADLLERLGVDRFVVIPFTQAFSQLSAEDFAVDILVEMIGLQEIVVGYDHGFGKGREGTTETLERLGRTHDFTVDVISAELSPAPVASAQASGTPPVDEAPVSSTRIRTLLQEEGDVARAADLLGRSYGLSGTVIRGAGRGKTIGYPTANVQPASSRKLVPRAGVYAVHAHVPGHEKAHRGMMNIGRRPTFENEDRHLEVHLFDFKQGLYGSELRVEFAARVRDERRFDSVEALQKQLSRDEARCRDLLQRSPNDPSGH